MEDIEMSNNDKDRSKLNSNIQDNKDCFLILDNIEKELKYINKTFSDSKTDIKSYTPLSERGNEINAKNINNNLMNIDNIDNIEKERNDFNNVINEHFNKMNDNFNNILNLAHNLKKYEDFMAEEDYLKKKLEELKVKNRNSEEKLKQKKKAVEIIFNNLKFENSMMNENKRRNEQINQITEEDLEF